MSGLKETSLYLKSSTQVHPFPFVGSVVELSVSLCSDSGRVVPGTDVPFQVVMQRKDDATSPNFNDSFQILNPEALRVCGSSGVAPPVKVQFLHCSVHKNMVLTVIPSDSSQTNIVSSSTNSFQVVRARLEITNESDIEKEWFKDEGGNDNQIELNVRLVRLAESGLISDGLITDTSRSSVKLKCYVTYENGEVAKEAEKRVKKSPSKATTKKKAKREEPLFEVSTDTKLFLDHTGYCHIKCRIGQVSLNHGQKKFQVWVVPDVPEPLSPNYDVSSTCTPAFLVKSKISKRNREERNLPAPAGAKRCKAANKATHDAQSISPVNVSDSCRFGGVDVKALMEFRTSVVLSLQKLKEQHEHLKMQQRQEQSLPGTLCADVMPTVYELLDLDHRLGLPPPFSSQSFRPDEASLVSESDSDDSDESGEQLIPDIVNHEVPLAPPMSNPTSLSLHRDTQGTKGLQEFTMVVGPTPTQKVMQPSPSLNPPVYRPFQSRPFVPSAPSVPSVLAMQYTVPRVASQSSQAVSSGVPVYSTHQSALSSEPPRGVMMRPPPGRSPPSDFTQHARFIASYGASASAGAGAGGWMTLAPPDPAGTSRNMSSESAMSCESVEDLNSVDPKNHYLGS